MVAGLKMWLTTSGKDEPTPEDRQRRIFLPTPGKAPVHSVQTSQPTIPGRDEVAPAHRVLTFLLPAARRGELAPVRKVLAQRFLLPV